MPLEQDELQALSDSTVEIIKEDLPDLEAEDIAGLYKLELQKSQPRNGVIEALLKVDSTLNDNLPEEEADEEGVDKYNKTRPHTMVWHKGNKCVLQNDKIYNTVSREFIANVKD